MSAVLLGDKAGLDAEMKKMYQKNGDRAPACHIRAPYVLYRHGDLRTAQEDRAWLYPCRIAGGAVLILYTVMIGQGCPA